MKVEFISHFLNLTDPRVDRTKQYLLIDIMVIAVCAVICGADEWKDSTPFLITYYVILIWTAKGIGLSSFVARIEIVRYALCVCR